jgi:hypothetical protein
MAIRSSADEFLTCIRNLCSDGANQVPAWVLHTASLNAVFDDLLSNFVISVAPPAHFPHSGRDSTDWVDMSIPC